MLKQTQKTQLAKFVFWSLLIITALAFFLFKARPQKNFSFFLQKAETLLPENIRPNKEKLEKTNYDEVLSKLKDPQNISYYENLFFRDIFSYTKVEKGEVSVDSLKLTAVKKAPLPLVFKGYIQQQDGSLIGQMDLDGKTVFVKSGSKILDAYRVKLVTKEYIQLVDKDNNTLTLGYLKQLPGKENIATILNAQDNTSYSIKEGQNLFNYLVLDIEDDFVVLFKNNSKYLLKKEK